MSLSSKTAISSNNNNNNNNNINNHHDHHKMMHNYHSDADESEAFDEDDESSETMLDEDRSRNVLPSKRRFRRKQHSTNVSTNENSLISNDELAKEDEEIDSDQSAQLMASDMIEILKNYAACKEKLFRWEQSKSILQQAPDTDANKQQLTEIIN